ncbi:right-handed parallel beta-helix repeat-containing protein [bacterium]|nr:right-handed parallel beta-helix repeat-containing protein [bacterium]
MQKFSVILILFLLISGTLSAQNWLVTHTGDEGDGSLRWALQQAAGHQGADTVQFAIPVSDEGYDGIVWFIRPLTVYANLFGDSLYLNGHSQTVFSGDINAEGPEIFLDGSMLEAGHYGLSITGSNQRINEIGFTGFSAYGISIWGDTAESNVVSMCFFGRYILNADTTDNTMGIFMAMGAHHNEIGLPGNGNIFAGNLGDAIHVSNVNNNIFAANMIGLMADGTALCGNGAEGIDMRDGSYENMIGGHGPESANIIVANGGSGIGLGGDGTSSNQVLNNNIGLIDDEGSDAGNHLMGIYIYGGASANVIGSEGTGNIVSGNHVYGIGIRNTGTDSNIVASNYIGHGIADGAANGNSDAGVRIYDGASFNRIGPLNSIRFQSGPGVWIDGAAALSNSVTENNITGNSEEGIRITNNANGGIASPVIVSLHPLTGISEPGSVIEIFSDIDDEGQYFEGQTNCDDNGMFVFSGELRGPSVTATVTDGSGNTSSFSVPFSFGSILVTNTSDSGEGSLRWALDIANSQAGPDTINFDISLTDPGFDGVIWRIKPELNLPTITDNSTMIHGLSQSLNQGNTNTSGPEIAIDGSLNQQGNGLSVISAYNRLSGIMVVNCSDFGIAVFGDKARNNLIDACYIGTTPDGLGTEGNIKGILFYDGAAQNIVGGTTPGLRNVLSGNINDAIHIDMADSNIVIGNYIGTDPTGLIANGNGVSGLGDGVDIRNGSKFNRVGGLIVEERNIISGNISVGVRMHGEGTSYNTVLGNYIGIDVDGLSAIPNKLYGVFIHEAAHSNTIGGIEDGACNVISGNLVNGVTLRDTGVENNQIMGNWIGLSARGNRAISNGIDGVRIERAANNNILGPDNVISGNVRHGVSIQDSITVNNIVAGNKIGLNTAGADTVANGGWGICCDEDTRSHHLGSESLGGNIVTGNRWGGISVKGNSADSIIIYNNWIGLTASGLRAPGNGSVGLSLEGSEHVINGNIIVASNGSGVVLGMSSFNCMLYGNRIGTSISGKAFPNQGDGIHVDSFSENHVIASDNYIWHNSGWGIALTDSTSEFIRISANSIWNNASGGISLPYGANGGIDPPVINASSPPGGIAVANARVEIFVDSSGQGRVYQGAVIADANGSWTWTELLPGSFITAVAVTGDGSTSAFSNVFEVIVSSVETEQLPGSFLLHQNFPNPFNPVTTIKYEVAENTHISLIVFNILGRPVAKLVDKIQSSGQYRIEFDASALPSGIYFYRIEALKFKAVCKMILLE